MFLTFHNNSNIKKSLIYSELVGLVQFKFTKYRRFRLIVGSIFEKFTAIFALYTLIFK